MPDKNTRADRQVHTKIIEPTELFFMVKGPAGEPIKQYDKRHVATQDVIGLAKANPGAEFFVLRAAFGFKVNENGKLVFLRTMRQEDLADNLLAAYNNEHQEQILPPDIEEQQVA